MTDSELTIKAREIARCLSYNGDPRQAAAKHVIKELAHRLDTLDVRAHKKSDGILLVNGIGKSRFATFFESAIFRIFGLLPRRV